MKLILFFKSNVSWSFTTHKVTGVQSPSSQTCYYIHMHHHLIPALNTEKSHTPDVSSLCALKGILLHLTNLPIQESNSSPSHPREWVSLVIPDRLARVWTWSANFPSIHLLSNEYTVIFGGENVILFLLKPSSQPQQHLDPP